MKNLKKVLFSLALVLGIIFSSVTPAYAKGKIEIVDDENPDGITGCSLVEPEYPAYDGEEEEDQEEQKDENKKPGKENNKKNNKK